jgi:hypothetical protein
MANSKDRTATEVTVYMIYAGDGAAIVLYTCVLLYQWRLKRNISKGGSAKNLIMPLYELVIWFLLCIAIGALIYSMTTLHNPSFSTDLTAGSVFAAERLTKGIFPLLFVQMPGLGIWSLVVPAIATVALVVPAILMTYLFKNPAKREEAFYVGASIRVIYMLLIIGLLFRRHPRTYKNVAIIRHTVVVICYMCAQIWFHSYFSINLPIVDGKPKVDIAPALAAQLTTTLMYICLVPSTLLLMIADTNYWRGVAKGSIDVEYGGTHAYIDFSRIVIRGKLDTGGHSIVYKGALDEDGVAIKIYKLHMITEGDIAAIKNEISVSVRMTHPNIVRCFGFSIIPPRILTVHELCYVTLTDYIYDHALSEVVVILLYEDICRGVQYIHSQGLIHRDMKTDNVMLSTDLIAKVIDFGETRKIIQEPQTIAGTPHYIAPELAQGHLRVQHTEKVDVFSLGVILWEMAHPGKDFYPSNWSMRDIMSTIEVESYIPQIHSSVLVVRELVTAMCDHEPANRPALPSVLKKLQIRRREIRQELLDEFDNSDWGSWLITNHHATGQRQVDRIMATMQLKNTLDPTKAAVAPNVNTL